MEFVDLKQYQQLLFERHLKGTLGEEYLNHVSLEDTFDVCIGDSLVDLLNDLVYDIQYTDNQKIQWLLTDDASNYYMSKSLQITLIEDYDYLKHIEQAIRAQMCDWADSNYHYLMRYLIISHMIVNEAEVDIDQLYEIFDKTRDYTEIGNVVEIVNQMI